MNCDVAVTILIASPARGFCMAYANTTMKFWFVTAVRTPVEVTYCGPFVVASHGNGNLVAGMNDTRPAESCTKVLNNAELVALSDAGVVSHKSCCQSDVPVELVTAYGKLSSKFDPVVRATTAWRPSAFGEPVAMALLAMVNPER